METKEILKFILKFFFFSGLIIITIIGLAIGISAFRDRRMKETIECEFATEAQRDHIEFCLEGDYFIEQPYQIKFEHGYFIAAQIRQSGGERPVGTGVWHVTGTPERPGMIMAINGDAKTATPLLPMGSTTAWRLNIYSKGVKEVQFCAENP